MRKVKAEAEAMRSKQLAIAEGMRITETEVTEAEIRARNAEKRLKELQSELESALSRSQAIGQAEERKLSAEEEIRRLERELEELRAKN